MAGFFQKLRNMLSKPKPPKIRAQVPGHRGVALGSRAKPDLENYRQRVQRGHEEISTDEVNDFLEDEQPMFVHSSNVVMVQYFPATNQMEVEFKRGAAYLYDNISPTEALSFANAQSKGIWVWSNLRIRGTKNGHRKPFKKIR